jgi:hypothetical protein
MLTLIMSASLACLGFCGALSIAAIDRTVAITIENAKIMWTLHKQNSKCKCNNWYLFKPKNGKVNGFQCECGYRYNQKKSLLS